MRVVQLVYLFAAAVLVLSTTFTHFALASAAAPSAAAASAAAASKKGSAPAAIKASPVKIAHGIDVVTPAPESEQKVVDKVQRLYNASKHRVSLQDQKQGKWDRILTIGDLHGDMQHTMTLLTDLRLISHQKDYYKDVLAKKARQDHMRISKGLKPRKKRAEAKYSADGLDEEINPNDVAANMLYNKRGDLMNGATADEYHWAGGKVLLVILGDSLNIGPDDIPIAQFLRRLTREASESKGKIVYVLGNHEVNNLKGNYLGVHPWSFESSGGEEGRKRLLSTATRLGRFLRSRPGVFYYDHLLFMHGGLMPQAIQKVQKITGHQNMTGEELADTINQHVRQALFDHENNPRMMDADPLAAVVTNVDYATNGEDGILLVHPLDKCDKVEESNRMALLQAQVVGHTPHDLPDYRFCDGSLYAIDFLMSQWKGGSETPLAALELTRVPLPGGQTDADGNAPYKWSSRLLIPKKDTLELIKQPHRIARLWFAFFVVVAVALVQGIIMLTRAILRRRKALAQFN